MAIEILLPLIVAVVVVIALAVYGRLLVRGVRAARRLGGEMLVTCPETKRPAAVEVSRFDAVARAMHGEDGIVLSRCSRWPERADCAQDCTSQVEADPEHARVSSIVERWYAGKTCVCCGKAIEAGDAIDDWANHRPALMDDTLRTSQWNELPSESRPEHLEHSWPVCWSCHEVEAFRREFPDLVTDRPPH